MAFNTTPAACRLLFPQLPPELRNEVYSYLVHDEEKPYTYLGMPFAPKTYNVGRTKITFAVVHQGNPSLLNLHKDKFLEAEEYFSCLVPTAVTLWVSVVVKGYMHKAEFASWKTKVEKRMSVSPNSSVPLLT
ncbi:hypothetical protein P154DRAFT_72704 [Amniculicola lignicola CBS 123094]|uniref:Uncharacterized protein n=1 Tax=Amniculicola lignicola CBS 123094 TaxID=1392246 RepID=A0A6A5WST8_9PLEO|nr:hypothetical protein P154DRAFT_72704 [Amniculicola lignicola CBS 123094]